MSTMKLQLGKFLLYYSSLFLSLFTAGNKVLMKRVEYKQSCNAIIHFLIKLIRFVVRTRVFVSC